MINFKHTLDLESQSVTVTNYEDGSVEIKGADANGELFFTFKELEQFLQYVQNVYSFAMHHNRKTS